MTTAFFTAEHALAWLAGRANYERTPPRGAGEFKLDRMRRLLALLGDPHERLPALHIAGTKGKGSTAIMAAAILTAAGYRAGLFTSPHVHRFEERMAVDGRTPTPAALVELMQAVATAAEALDPLGPDWSPTYFELATAMAWLYFERNACEIVVLEVGLGGRLDATNLCRPLATAITNISYDHTEVLGHTLEAIAGEKAGIIKAGVPVVAGVEPGPSRDVIALRASRLDCPLYELGRHIHYHVHTSAPAAATALGGAQTVDLVGIDRDVRLVALPLAGAHQAANASIALGLMDLAGRTGWRVPDAAVRSGLAGVAVPVRIEFFPGCPRLVIDAAHNVASTAALAETLRAHPALSGRRVLIFAASKDKDAAGMLRVLSTEFDQIVLTRYTSSDRGLPVEYLSALAAPGGGTVVHEAENPAAAWDVAHRIAGADDLICATGSFFLAAELREMALTDARRSAAGR
jgi:dihydrofolate synthase/folylpolyglutamate synthase